MFTTYKYPDYVWIYKNSCMESEVRLHKDSIQTTLSFCFQSRSDTLYIYKNLTQIMSVWMYKNEKMNGLSFWPG